MRPHPGIVALLAFSIAGWSGPSTAQDDAVAAALAHPERPAADRGDDAARKPGDVLGFFGITPGLDVLDLLAGGGYYTELVARIVGTGGSVLFHNNQAYLDFLGEEVTRRTAGGRLANVAAITTEVDDLELEQGSLDAVIFVLGFHDIYYRDDSWRPIDPDRLLAMLHRALRPGGILGIVDHSAATGADPWQSGTDLHRIDEAFVKRQIEAAGFVLEGSSDVLRNPSDDRTVQVFEPAIRRQTDRFVLRFRRPQ